MATEILEKTCIVPPARTCDNKSCQNLSDASCKRHIARQKRTPSPKGILTALLLQTYHLKNVWTEPKHFSILNSKSSDFGYNERRLEEHSNTTSCRSPFRRTFVHSSCPLKVAPLPDGTYIRGTHATQDRPSQRLFYFCCKWSSPRPSLARFDLSQMVTRR